MTFVSNPAFCSKVRSTDLRFRPFSALTVKYFFHRCPIPPFFLTEKCKSRDLPFAPAGFDSLPSPFFAFMRTFILIRLFVRLYSKKKNYFVDAYFSYFSLIICSMSPPRPAFFAVAQISSICAPYTTWWSTLKVKSFSGLRPVPLRCRRSGDNPSGCPPNRRHRSGYASHPRRLRRDGRFALSCPCG